VKFVYNTINTDKRINMYHRESIILYNVLNQEVVFQEYFCNLLQFPNFRNLFIDFINEHNCILKKEDIKYNNFNTEIILPNNCGRADLSLKINNDEFIFEIKNKCYTTLTTNQPNSYLLHLNKKNENLYFLIPKKYAHKEELKNIWKEFNEYNNIEQQIFYWEDFITKMTTSKIYNKHLEINFFYEFCLYWFDMEIIKFTKEEKMILTNNKNKTSDFTNKSIPSALKKIEAIINNIGSNSDMKIDNDTVGYNYSKKINDYVIYFGIDYDIWESQGIPLSILIQNHKVDYNDFELELNGVLLEKIYYNETKDSPQQVGYRVINNNELGNDDFQDNTKRLIAKILEQI